jgi:hypothetical protein
MAGSACGSRTATNWALAAAGSSRRSRRRRFGRARIDRFEKLDQLLGEHSMQAGLGRLIVFLTHSLRKWRRVKSTRSGSSRVANRVSMRKLCIRLATCATRDLRHSARLKNVPRQGCEPRVGADFSKAGATNNIIGRDSMITRRFLLQSAAAAAAYSAQGFRAARAENAPGVTDTEIKIGQTMPYSGPLSAYGVIVKPPISR